ncbi:hypothetical protein [Pediococcus acidilactici]|uniref:hypothetical protein n=1 Tax=Pediococcus acidilactici TaxID=1254 RepID=UPI000FEF9235|nr:hypothetical protein [Pediococcus acidilactici]RWY85760.1 hypothetical protein EQG54_02890 [Pediococcus acidilactici]
MKKILTLGVIAMSSLALVACGVKNNTKNDDSNSSSKITKKRPLVTADNNKITYPKHGTIEIVGFKKDTIKADATTDVDRGENVYLLEMKVTNTSKKELDVDDITNKARINFLQDNNGSLKNVETSTGVESVASPDNTDLYNKYIDATGDYDNKIMPGKSSVLLYPSVIHLANGKNPLIIQVGSHDKDDKSVNLKKDRLTYSIKQLDKMSFSTDFISKFGNNNSSNPDNASSNSTQNGSNSSKKVATNNSEPKTLSEFINKYGMSPVAYKIQHDGMSREQALKSTPDTMKSSGELQSQYLMEHPVNNDNSNEKDSQFQDSTNESEDDESDEVDYDSDHMTQDEFDKKYVTVDMYGNPINGH